jgi:transposase
MPGRYDGETKRGWFVCQGSHGRLRLGAGSDQRDVWSVRVSAETLCKWVRRAEVDTGAAPGVSTESAREIRELKRKNAELERTIEILKAATSLFVRECDPLRR